MITRLRAWVTAINAPPTCRRCGATMRAEFAVAPPEGIVRFWVHPRELCDDSAKPA